MAGKPKVAMVAFGPESALWLARDLATRAEVHLFLPEGLADYARGEPDSHARIVGFPWGRFYRALRQLRAAREVVDRIRALDPDVVHVHQGHHTLNLLLGRLAAFPLVVTAHEPSFQGRAQHAHRRPPQLLTDVAFRRADQVIVHAEVTRAALVPRGVPEGSVHVIPRAMPALANGTNPAEEGPVVLLFGRLFAYKGFDHLIRAMPRVAESVPGARAVVAGEGVEEDRIRALVADSPCVTLDPRFFSREERDRLFASASVVALPYLDANTSAVLPLAQLHGKPVVAADVGGLAEQVGEGGIVVPAGDEEALAGALIRLLRDGGLRRRLAAAGRAKLERESAAELVTGRTLAVYDLARPRAYT